jgi:tetratricopeptide (TPR) repeat protein
MGSDVSRSVSEILGREMGPAGAAIMERQCRQLGLDRENLQAEDLPGLAGRLSEVMRVMGGHQKANRIYQQIRKLADLDRIAELARTDDSRLAMFEDLARASMFSGEWDKAVFYYKKLLHNAEVNRDRAGTSKYLAWIGAVHKERSDLDEAMRFYERAERFAEASGDGNQLANCLYRMGDVLWCRGEWDGALDAYRKAINLAADRKFKGAANVGIGNVLVGRRDLAGAVKHYQEALALLDGTDDYLDRARAYNNIGDVQLQLGEWDRAIECFRRGGELAEKGGWLNIRAFTQFNAADAHVSRGDYGKARELLDECLETLKLIDSKSGVAGASHIYAKLFRATKDYPAMVEKYAEAIELYRQAEVPFYEAQCSYELGEGYAQMGDDERARECFQEAARIYGQLKLDDMVEKATGAMRGARGALRQ